jgi:Domain of unknown function (DUF4412)
MKGPLNRSTWFALTGFAMVAWGATGIATAGVYVEMVEHDLTSNETELVQKMYVQDGAGRFVDVPSKKDAPEDGTPGVESAMLIKGGTLHAVDDANRSYVVLDRATLDQLAKKMDAVVAQVREQLAKMPAEQREQMEPLLAKQIPGLAGKQEWTVEAIDTGKMDKVGGRSCRVWDLKRNGELDEQLCVVPFNALPGKENIQAVFAEFARVFEEMAKSVPTLAGMMSNEFSAQEKINGFPVRSRDYENGKLSSLERLMSVWREEKIPASTFEIPAGYHRKTMEELAGQ